MEQLTCRSNLDSTSKCRSHSTLQSPACVKPQARGIRPAGGVRPACSVPGEAWPRVSPVQILGACNPPLAFSAISADPSVGLLLPCNVTVEWLAEGRTGVRLTDPEALLSTVVLQGAPALTSVAHDARERMVRVAEWSTRVAWRTCATRAYQRSLCDVVLRDGSTLPLRPAGQDDIGALISFFAGLSPESRYYRFFGVPTLDSTRVAGLIPMGATGGMALVGECGGRHRRVPAPWRRPIRSSTHCFIRRA